MFNLLPFNEAELGFMERYVSMRKHTFKISRLAVELNRPYGIVMGQLIKMGLLKNPAKESKFLTPDEQEYELLIQGFSEEEIKTAKASTAVACNANYSYQKSGVIYVDPK